MTPPALQAIIDQLIVPALLERLLAQQGSGRPLAEPSPRVIAARVESGASA